jgi:ribosomal protein S18 acetylase RimI-like enzyme
MASMNIRSANVEDGAIIAAIHTRSWRETYSGLIPDRVIESRTNIEERTAEWEERLAHSDPDSLVFVAEVSDRIVGFVWIGPSSESVQRRIPGFVEHMYALYVLASEHRRGIGRDLIRASVNSLMRRGRLSLSLDVLATNPARMFYERLGAKHLATTTIQDGSDSWEQCAYGWIDIRALR